MTREYIYQKMEDMSSLTLKVVIVLVDFQNEAYSVNF